MFTNTLILKSQVAAVVLIAAGYGWAGGHFVPAGSPVYFYFFQFAVILILLILSLRFLGAQLAAGPAPIRSGWAFTGLNVFAVVTLVINIANIIRGFSNSSQDAFGSHNTLADLIPIGIIIIGDLIWLAAATTGKRLKS